MVSTPGDLNTFLRALLDGRLLEQAQLAQMRTTVETGDEMEYGLGLMRIPLSCGGVYWSHGGDIPGYSVRDGATDDGRVATLAVTAMASSVKNESAMVAREEFVDTALCAK
jgi:D-alanyl-D-alanine carboxypeptidase